ncbi:MAG TPA: helix-turn-helix transcriptional regulator [Solimonas sp.]|nr:helix-turn-helix transcriptional regulator [Solimonas sp.]
MNLPISRRAFLRDNLPSLVRSTLDGAEGDYPSLTRTAASMCMSPRTLKRRLRSHGLGFRKLIDGARQQEALRLLQDRRLTVEQIATMVGYSSPANFSRAFRRWCGQPPGLFRQAMDLALPDTSGNERCAPDSGGASCGAAL